MPRQEKGSENDLYKYQINIGGVNEDYGNVP